MFLILHQLGGLHNSWDSLEVLKTVAERAARMASEMSLSLPYPLVYKVTAMSNSQITDIVKEAN